MSFDRAYIQSMAAGQGLFNVFTSYTGGALTYAALIDCGSEGGLALEKCPDSKWEQIERLHQIMKDRAATCGVENVDLYLDLVLISHMDHDHYNWIEDIFRGLTCPLTRMDNEGREYKEVLSDVEVDKDKFLKNMTYLFQKFRIYDRKGKLDEAYYEETFDEKTSEFPEAETDDSGAWSYTLFKSFPTDTPYYMCGICANLSFEEMEMEEDPQDVLRDGIALYISNYHGPNSIMYPFEHYTYGKIVSYEIIDSTPTLICLEICSVYDKTIEPPFRTLARLSGFPVKEDEGEEEELPSFEYKGAIDIVLSYDYIDDMIRSLSQLVTEASSIIPMPHIYNRIQKLVGFLNKSPYRAETIETIYRRFFDESGNRVTNEGNNTIIKSVLFGGTESKRKNTKVNKVISLLNYFSELRPNQLPEGAQYSFNSQNLTITFIGINEAVSTYFDKNKNALKLLQIKKIQSLENANSVLAAFSLSFSNNERYKALFTGDATGHTMYYLHQEKVRLIANSVFLTAPHHGSIITANYASNLCLKTFIEDVRPVYVMISAAHDSKFGHPHRSFLSALYNYYKNSGIAVNPHYLIINTNDCGMRSRSQMALAWMDVPIYANASSFSDDPPEYKNYTFQINLSGCSLPIPPEKAFMNDPIKGNYDRVIFPNQNQRNGRILGAAPASHFHWDKRPARITERRCRL